MAQRRQKGIFGLPAKYKDVRETNNRGSFHVHGAHHGGGTLALLAEIAENVCVVSTLCVHVGFGNTVVCRVAS